MEEVCKRILASDKAIRLVAIGSEKGEVLGLAAREDLAATVLPKYEEVITKFGETWIRVIWGIVDEIGKYMGKANRIIVYHEGANWMTLKVDGKIAVFSMERQASPEILAAKVEAILKSSSGLERGEERSRR